MIGANDVIVVSGRGRGSDVMVAAMSSIVKPPNHSSWFLSHRRTMCLCKCLWSISRSWRCSRHEHERWDGVG